jgi:hypothetical protein
MIDYAAILSRKYFGKEWTLDGDSYEGLTWNDKTEKPSRETLDDLWLSVSLEIEAEKNAKILLKQSVLDKLGISEQEAKVVFG